MFNNQDKSELRQEMLLRRRQLTSEEHEKLSREVWCRLQSMEEYRQADAILCYASCRKEVDTFQIIERTLADGRCVALPKVTGPGQMVFLRIRSLDDLVPGFMGIPEPGPSCTEELQEGLLLVPGTTFDRQMHRMGYGGGYYDRWLAGREMQVTACGLAYDFQLLAAIPFENHDRQMDLIITPGNILRRGDIHHDD